LASIPLLTLWFVCALGAPVFSAVAPLRRAGVAVFAVAFVAATGWAGPQRLPATDVIAAAVALGAAVQLLRPHLLVLPWLLAAVLAGTWTAALELQRLSPWLSPLVALGLCAASAVLARRRREFATPLLREEALLFVCVLGLVAAITPGVIDGWRAAVDLNLDARVATDTAVPAWTVAATAGAVALGAVYSLWSRR
jgi:hypothetical protein